MMEVVLTEADARHIKEHLLGEIESCAVLLANQVDIEGATRLLVHRVETPCAEDYFRRSSFEAELTPSFVARITKTARSSNSSIVFAHSHSGTVPPEFSEIDDQGEALLSEFLNRRHPGREHAALVVSAGGMRARRIGTADLARVLSIGMRREVLFDPDPERSLLIDETFDRQERVLGRSGQKILQQLRVAIVGLGGTGSVVAQELAHLGVRHFVVADPDVVEATNLNRLAGATIGDLGIAKTTVARRHIESINRDAHVTEVVGDITHTRFAQQLLGVDLIFGCTDSHGSRAILQQVAYQYLIPCIDMGVAITVDSRRITHVFGRVQMLSPGLACLTCSKLLDPAQVRRDMMSGFERQQDPYLRGAREPEPAVMSLNATIASLGVTMMLSAEVGFPMSARHILYDALKPAIRSVLVSPEQNCYICSRAGALARGDSWPLNGRAD